MAYDYQAALFAERNRNRVYDIVVAAIEEAAAQRGITRKEMAQKIGKHPAQVSMWLSGPSNWTLDTISDLLFSVDAEMDYSSVPFSERVNRNVHHPAGEPARLSLPRSEVSTGSSSTVFVVPQILQKQIAA